MQQLQCIIVDDEPLPLELFADYIQKTPFLQLVSTFSNPLKALTAIKQQKVDLIFLDIQMPELNGIQFMQLINGKSKVIFTTAYPNYALIGYELDVIDYLLKPVSFERFLKAVNKAFNIILPGTAYIHETTTPIPSFDDQVLFVKANHKIIKILLGDILYIEGLKEYIAIHTVRGKIITLLNMKKMEEVLPATAFSRVHKSFIVAMDKIDSIERNRIFIKNNVIAVGETYREHFFSLLNKKKLL